MAQPLAVGFLGAGQMATALAVGWAKAGLLDRARSLASDPYPTAQSRFAATTGLTAITSNADLMAAADLVVVAVKPQVLPQLLTEIAPLVEPRHLIVSIAAGATLQRLSNALGLNARVVRVMPNTPALVGASASGIAGGTAEDAALVERLFTAVGTAVRVPEPLLDAVTGLSGSGPAYVFVLIEALADGGVRAGLSRDVAMKLAAQTVFGAAKMVIDTGSHPAALKDAVASPSGTTIAGLHALERAGFRAGLMDAVMAAAERATELGRPVGHP